MRAEATARGLPVGEKPDSYDLCFVADGDTQGFLRSHLGAERGDVVDADGAVVGGHDGAWAYTVGQRKGLGLGTPAADGRPRYVLDVRPATNTVVVGPAELLTVAGLRGAGAVWFDPPAARLAAGHGPASRARDARAGPLPSGRVTSSRCGSTAPVRGLAAGQSAVCYDGDRVTVQATIDEVRQVTGVTVLGPWPGHKVLKAQDVAFTELADVPSGVVGMPPMVHMPKRGPYAESTARTAALLEGMPVELGTHGWKLADRPGLDLERSAALLREDLDALAVLGHAWAGPLVVTARGPWSLAAALWLARGDRVLSDHGAVRELVESLAEGLALLVARVRQAAPYAEIVLVLREPHLPDVLGGAVSTFSGHGRIRSVPSADASAALDRVIGRVRDAGAARVVAHGGARFASRSLAALLATGADGVGVAAAGVRAQQWEPLAEAVERGAQLWFGLPRDHPRKGGPDIAKVARLIHRPWTDLGLPAGGLADVVVHTDTNGAGDQVLGNLQAAAYETRTAVRVAEARSPSAQRTAS